MSECVSFLLPWTGVLAQLFPGQGGLSVLLSVLPGSPGVKCFWAMQEGGLREPLWPSQGAGVDLERERGLQRVRLTRAILEGEAVTNFAPGRRGTVERRREPQRPPPSLPGLGREAWLHLPVPIVAGSPAASQLQLRLCESRPWTEKVSQEPRHLQLKELLMTSN